MFLRNTWYVAAWASEVTDALVGRRLLGEPVVIYRGDTGTPFAIGDRCPHRFAPLHLGRRTENAVQCGYHGLVFGSDGQCVANPQAGGHIPPGARVKAYPLIERHGLLWIWMGPAELATVETIPDLAFMLAEGAASSDGYLHVRADYRLVTDNLMDLSHAAYLHEETLGLLTPSLHTGELQVARSGDSIEAAITMRDITLPGTDGRVDQWLDIRWTPPGILVLDIGHVASGDARPDHGRRAVHLVTPETATTSHYFFRNSANPLSFKRDPFSQEDEPMLAECQEMMCNESFWALRPVILPSDAGAIRVRRRLEQLMRDENAAITAEAIV